MQKENQYTIIGKEFVRTVKGINFDEETNFMPILDVLNLIKIKEGYVLDFFKTDPYEYHTLPYVRKEEEERWATKDRLQMFFFKNKPNLFNNLEIPFTEMGVWQGYLLHILPGLTPKGGHANYHATEEVYGYDDFVLKLPICHNDKRWKVNDLNDKRCKGNDLYYSFFMKSLLGEPIEELFASILDALGIETFLPKVEINTQDKATIESLFFSKFGGLIFEATTAIRDGNSLKFEPKDQRVLIKYNCGICY